MDGSGFVIGCGLISIGIYCGLEKIAKAIRFNRPDINSKDDAEPAAEMDSAGQLPRPGMVPKPAPWPEPPPAQ